MDYDDDDDDDYEYEDDITKDPDFECLDYHTLEPTADELETSIKHCVRFGISSAQAMIILNCLLLNLKRDDLMICRKSTDKVMKRIKDEATARREDEDQNLICISFDGKVSDTKYEKNKVRKTNNITVIRQPNPR